MTELTDPPAAALLADIAPQTVKVDGRELTVHELRWGEGMRLMPKLLPVLGDLRAVLDDMSQLPALVDSDALVDAFKDMPLARVDAMLYAHPEAWIPVTAKSCRLPIEELEDHADALGSEVMRAVFTANFPFFARKLADSTRVAMILAMAMRTAPPSPTSSSPSSAPDSAEISQTLPAA